MDQQQTKDMTAKAREKLFDMLSVALTEGPNHIISGVSSNDRTTELAARLGYIAALQKAIEIIDESMKEEDDERAKR